jgi:protein TonB
MGFGRRRDKLCLANPFCMEAKKNPSADIYAKALMFRSLGLMIALSLVALSFEWKTYDKGQVQLPARNTNTFEEVLDIPPTEQPPPPPPQVISSQIIEVADEEVIKEEIKIHLDLEVTDQTRVENIVAEPAIAELEKEESEKIFTIVEETASPKGGLAAFYGFVKENIKYPAAARRMGIQGRVYVEFVIAKDGTLTDVHIVKGIGAGCDEEAVRIVQAAPPWNPGKQRGKPVRQRYTLPIVFKWAEARPM